MTDRGRVASTAERASAPREASRSGERRIDVRVPLDVPVLFDAAAAQGVTRSENISLRGIEVDHNPKLRIGYRVLLYLELPIGLAIEERAVVVRESRNGVVLRFLALTQSSRAALSAYVRRECLSGH